MSLDSFRDILAPIFGFRSRGSGGRKPEEANQPSLDVDEEGGKKTWLTPCQAGEARLTVVQITDVYTLENFASLKTLIATIRAAQGEDGPRNRVITMLTGDFLSPYLLSSVDRGAGMMKTLAATPIDYLTWGNHEADIDHRTTCKHVRDWSGKFINSNMQQHDAMKYQQPYEVIEIESADGTNKRRIGLVAVLSNDPKLYSHFKKPGAFGGATIEDPWETLRKYKALLEDFEECDVVLPLEHLYVPENHKTCEEFDFPVILSGHDHHRIDEIVNGTRLIKPGMDGVYATVLEIIWEDGAQPGDKPKVRSTFVETAKWDPCPELKEQTEKAYNVLAPLRNTQLAGIPPEYEPLSSKDARGSVSTMGRLICSMLKSSLEQTRDPDEKKTDAVILMGGNIRGGEDYPPGSYFSLETLEQEIKSDEIIGVVPIPGSVLAAGIEATHAGDPIPGWMQYDDGISEETTPEGKKRVTKVAGRPLDPNRIYRVATKISDLTNGQSPPLKEYFEANRELLPARGNYINIQSELMGFFARNLWRTLWDAIGEMIPDPEEVLDASKHKPHETIEKVESRLRLEMLDRDGSGMVTVDDIHVGLRDFLGLSVDNTEKTLARHVHSIADVTGDGKVTKYDFELFCLGAPPDFKPVPRKWSDAFPDPLPTPPASSSRASSPKPEEKDGMKRIETEETTLMF